MDDDIQFEPKRIPFSEINRFKEYLASLAEEEEEKVVFTERYADVKISLGYLLEVYEAGTEKKIPAAWVPLYDQMKKEENSEYQMYLELERKYSQRRSIAEITIDKTIVENEEKAKKISGSKKRRVSSDGGRKIIKDGKMAKFK